MASVAVDKLSPVEKDNLAISYAAFVLSGTKAEVTSESLNAVIQAAGLKVSQGILNAFAKSLKGKNVADLFAGVGGGESAPVEATKEPKADKKEKKVAPVVEAPPPPAEEEEGMDMGGLFD